MLALDGTAEHSDCSASQCQFAEKGKAFDGYREVEVYGKPIRFKGCPQSHLIGAGINKWFTLYRWLNEWHTTPMMMGVPVERVDPVFFEAMELISDTMALQKAEKDGG